MIMFCVDQSVGNVAQSRNLALCFVPDERITNVIRNSGKPLERFRNFMMFLALPEAYTITPNAAGARSWTL